MTIAHSICNGNPAGQQLTEQCWETAVALAKMEATQTLDKYSETTRRRTCFASLLDYGTQTRTAASRRGNRQALE